MYLSRYFFNDFDHFIEFVPEPFAACIKKVFKELKEKYLANDDEDKLIVASR